MSQTSNGVLATMEGRAQWVQSYVTDDKIYCVYIADNRRPYASTPPRGDSRPTSDRSSRCDRSHDWRTGVAPQCPCTWTVTMFRA